MAIMPAQKPGRSKQDYSTPDVFLTAVKTRLGISEFDADLAASDTNAVAYPYFTAERSAFDAPTWKMGSGWNWLNPPFNSIGPWVERAWSETNVNAARTAVLLPASVGANWWRDHVHGRAEVLCLNGRLTFAGCDDPYPKDCALLLFDRVRHPRYDIWTWQK